AEDGIRDYKVTGVQTCALPILGVRFQVRSASRLEAVELLRDKAAPLPVGLSAARRDETGAYELTAEVEVELPLGISRLRVRAAKIGRASCRERGWDREVGGVGT